MLLGTLYLVATPIGNLQDMTFRAVEILKTVDLIACEDTRHTRKLLTHYGISNRLVSYHEHNEHERAEELAARMQEGKSIAVVSDAGTPAICDPAFRIVQKAHEIGARVVSIPGAAAFLSALVISGLPTDSAFFGGFLPSRKSERQKRLAEVKPIPATLVFYETPHRLAKSLADCAEVLGGGRKAFVVRELTKLHEEIARGNLDELAESFSEKSVRGEIVLVIDREENQSSKPAAQSPKSLALRVRELEKELDHKTALKKAAKEFGLPRSEAYRILISEKNK
ncbi:MAG TPA: 16S rRNA (cytidine(1402)-2'-O)-methyltransferase [Pyrinomonadaceae bacterium]|nr:16S rRNA (cytidine(1402)-2'-O)-methyltransferase [Pyrinomonadaceae bacterium]